MRKTVAAASAIVVGALVVAVGWIFLPLPQSALARDSDFGVTILDRHGALLRSTRAADGSSAKWVSYERMDPDLINAFIAVEDRRFWEHQGIDPRAVARAFRDNLRAGHVVSGASTITMQLARLMRPAGRNWGGKAIQALYALRLERHLGKQQILEQYLNRVELGQGTAGVAAASALYFGTSPSELSVAQAATLAGLAHAPSRDNPHVSARRARARRSVALARMHRLGFVTRDDVARSREEPVATGGRNTAPFLAPHFTTRVLGWTADEPAARDKPMRTSIDAALQAEIEGEVRHTVSMLRDRGVMHAAAVVLDNNSGEVLAWVGSPNFWESGSGQTDMVMSPRQPGSALKPFLYALAFDRGFTAATVLPDIPKAYATALGPYQPRNYDRRFRGPTRAREALASSYNVPAVELAERVGTPALLQTLRLAGFTSLERDAEYYGLGLALGNGDVTLIELANGYRALANRGEWRPWTWRTDSPSHDAKRVASRAATAIVLDILQDPNARIPGFGLSTPFDFPFPVAVKTGTSRHFTDNWAVGTTRNFTVAVWAGNFSGRPMEGVSGITGAGPLLHRVVMATASRVTPGALETPREAGAVMVPVCRLSGMRAANGCPEIPEWFTPATVPTMPDDWERGGRVTLPDVYADWAPRGLHASIGTESSAVTIGGTPVDVIQAGNTSGGDRRRRTAVADSAQAARAARAAVFRIVSPLDGDRYAVPIGIEAKYATIPLRAGGMGADRVEWAIDGKPFAAERWALVAGEHVIAAISARGDTAKVRITVDR